MDRATAGCQRWFPYIGVPRYNRTVVQFSNRRSQRADARRVGILKAAASVFRARGFAAAGMREIAIAADLSPANLYHYFRGKDELLYFCQDRTLDHLLAALAAARRSPDPLPDRLRRLAEAHVLNLLDEVEGSAAHFEVDALPRRLRTLIVAKRDRYERGIRTLIADGIQQGAFAATDPDVAARACLGALNWTAHWFRPDGAHDAAYVAAIVADFIVQGLNPRSHATHPPVNRAGRQRRAHRGRVRVVQDAARGSA
jgi:AcrR family transcriptional regulator